jgi:hypothetical protein
MTTDYIPQTEDLSILEAFARLAQDTDWAMLRKFHAEQVTPRLLDRFKASKDAAEFYRIQGILNFTDELFGLVDRARDTAEALIQAAKKRPDKTFE